MNNKAITIINDYIATMPQIRPYLKRHSFMQISYSRWIAHEILELIKICNTTPAMMVIEDYVSKLDEWSCVSRDNGIIFSIARDTALDILDYLYVNLSK